ncbi:phosphotransferase [Actinomadura barringtoniae]|uniref:Phosphotransferase n=1 Tax=Actinomadura barringtoniae TaxID=1427535 RepID=A0A939PUU2_9ACTN|nr:phosphotransferase [Actinomadura barringtoniae]MBO2455434.1 phosphotransferase [Actinomadura barringtoniae]
MFSEPDDPAVRDRMQAAFNEAATQLSCEREPEASMAWGHNGRTLGVSVNAPSGRRAWLRVMEAPAGKAGGKLWTGTEEAATTLPDEVPRPHLLRAMDWAQDQHAYRAELTSYVPAPVCSQSPDLTKAIDLPHEWWSRLRQASNLVTQTPAPDTRPPVISQDYIHRTIPRYLGEVDINTTVQRWSLAHGDLHWANLTGPQLTILDWEGFGPAPHGFDAAHLHAYTLPVPDLAARVRATFADVLSTQDGRLVELTVAAILLQAAERDPVHARLSPLVHAHVRGLLTSPAQ